jgi:hypothetical protein
MPNAYELTSEERERFERDGWIGPYPLLRESEAQALAPHLKRAFGETRGYYYPDRPELERFYAEGGSHYEDTPWFQSLHALSPELLAVGCEPAVVERVAQLIGEDVMLWATICFLQEPGARLHWHSDNEFHAVSGVSAWLGAANTTPENALKLMPGSHRFPKRPEDYLSVGEETMESLQDDAHALAIARQWQPEAEIVRPEVRDGEFIVFTGTLWHGSDNPGSAERCAVGLRYSAPDQRIRIPMTAWEPTIWDPASPPTVMVRGEDRYGLNSTPS